MTDIRIVYGDEKYFASFRDALHSVAQERIYLALTEAPPIEDVAKFQQKIISANNPTYYALDTNDRVVGWCDIVPHGDPHTKHRATLGMGILEEFRGRGIGSKLMASALEHAKTCGLEKIELSVYTTNERAIALYKKHGFEQEGLLKKYRKLDKKYCDCLMMAKFL